jgi:hypothetical protein
MPPAGLVAARPTRRTLSEVEELVVEYRDLVRIVLEDGVNGNYRAEGLLCRGLALLARRHHSFGPGLTLAAV